MRTEVDRVPGCERWLRTYPRMEPSEEMAELSHELATAAAREGVQEAPLRVFAWRLSQAALGLIAAEDAYRGSEDAIAVVEALRDRQGTAPSWETLTEVQQTAVLQLLEKPRGQSVKGWKLLGPDRDNGRCRDQLNALVPAVLMRLGRNTGYRLVALPRGLPVDLPRHESWQG